MSWSLRGVDEETREAVIEAARQSGLSVGDWLKAVLEEDGDPTHRQAGRGQDEDADAMAATVARLRDRLAEAETQKRRRSSARQEVPNALSAIIDEIARGLDTDEEARTEIEGLDDRRPAPAADPQAVSEAIHNLERQIAGLNRRMAASPPDRSTTLEDIRDSLTALLARPATKAGRTPDRTPDRAAAVDEALSALEARLDEARRRVAASSRQDAAGGTSRGVGAVEPLETRLAEITGRLGPATAAQGPRTRPTGTDLASAVAEISERQRKLDRTATVPKAEVGHTSLAATLAALRGDIAALAERIAAAGDDGAKVDRSHADLARRLDALAAEQPRDRKLLDAIRDDLSVVRGALADSARRATRADGDRERLDRFAQEISALRRALENAQGPGAIARLEARVTDLARMLESALAAETGPPQGVTRLETSLDDIRRAIDELQAAAAKGGTDSALSRVDTRLNQIVTRLDQALERTSPTEALDAIRSEIAALRTELAGQTRASGDQLAAQIRALADRLDRRVDVDREGRALAELEAQIAAIAEQIGRTMPRPETLQRVEQSLSQLQTSLAGQRGEAVEAARKAAREAVREVSASKQAESSLIHSLRDDLDDLRRAADAADDNGPAAASETLTEVVRRLSQLEREASETMTAAGGPSIARANRAAAAAWNAAYRGESTAADTSSPSTTSRTDMAALRELVASGEVPATQRGGDRRSDFIAAARRAAQAAEGTAPAERGGAAAKSSTFARIGEAIRSHKGSLLVAAAGLALALGAMQLKSGAGDEDSEPLLVGASQPGAGAAIVDGGSPIDAAAPPALASGNQPALVASLGAPDPALAFAEPTRFADHFGGPVTPSSGTFTAGVTGAAESTSPNEALVDAAASAPWPDARSLATAAAGGDGAAAFAIAVRYAGSDDLAKAAAWYEHAAAIGNAVAQYRVASLYEHGRGVTQDMAKAVGWYRRAAEQGNVEAMHNLAVILSEGATGPAHRSEALTWFLAAAKHGVTDSQFNLGVIYGRGIGVEQDVAESYKWFAIAAAQGDREAAERRDQIGARLSPNELAGARAAADAWRAAPVVAAANAVAMAYSPDGAGDGLDTADRQALVRKIQTLLAEQGYDPGPADGVEGPRTRQAIRAYQRNIGLSETGRIDTRLVATLADAGG